MVIGMVIGIVGSEALKFDPRTEDLARDKILDLISVTCGVCFGTGRTDPALLTCTMCNGKGRVASVDKVVSGACHLGGIDVWAIEEATMLGIPNQEFPPKARSWEEGYKARNIQIADASQKVVCITVKSYPEGYKDLRFPFCYHCKTKDHVKSGGCWTVKYARRLGKEGEIIVIE